MKSLYFVRLYNSRDNQYLRILISVPEGQNDKDAERLCLESESNLWRTDATYFVCKTNDNVCQYH